MTTNKLRVNVCDKTIQTDQENSLNDIMSLDCCRSDPCVCVSEYKLYMCISPTLSLYTVKFIKRKCHQIMSQLNFNTP